MPIEVFEAKHEEDWPDRRSGFPPNPEGTRFEEEQLDALFPKLTAKVAELEEI